MLYVLWDISLYEICVISKQLAWSIFTGFCYFLSLTKFVIKEMLYAKHKLVSQDLFDDTDTDVDFITDSLWH